MLNFLFTKNVEKKAESINKLYTKLKKIYKFNEIDEGRKNYLENEVKEHGYLPYPYVKALEELTPAEILFALEIKWTQNGIFKNGKFEFENNNISALSRNGVKNSDWIKKEGHNIKLINLAGLGDGNKTSDTGKFIDWLRQLLILPTGNLENKILNTTIYLIPFHPREFGCAYLPTSSDVSQNLLDTYIRDELGLNAKEQVQTFITLAQLAGHPVIYDILPQTGRFAKVVLANPSIARWYDIKDLMNKIEKSIESIATELSEKLSSDDVNIVKNIFLQTLYSGAGELSEHYQTIYDEFEEKLDKIKIELSNKMLERAHQEKLHKRVKAIVSTIHGMKPEKKFVENDITKQGDCIQSLIKEGLWPAPGGAWCSAGVPVFDKMSECGSYPMFKHYDFKGEDVTHYANLDCQTPYYFVYLESGKYNQPVIDFFVNHMKKLQNDYNFDGFRIDHIDHVVDEVSAKDNVPISYRAPAVVLSKLNTAMKEKIPYFATLAEYMLWDKYYKEYHKDMNFDILWGNDIISQSDKTPQAIVDDNSELSNYNTPYFKSGMLSILKTYNNQDGEFEAIDRYPGQLGENGALFKWFKYKFLPGGKLASRPVMYVDGDESFTKTGIESVIGAEVSMQRAKNYEFFAQFDAIDRFVKNNELITEGEAQIIEQDDDGYVCWMISKEPLKTALLIVANYHAPFEKFSINDEDGISHIEIREGKEITDKKLRLPGDFRAVAEYKFDGKNISQIDFATSETEFEFGVIKPSEYKIYKLVK